MKTPLEKNKIRELLRINADGHLYKRESTTLEFKEDFDWDIKISRLKYVKTIAAFANRNGGYLIFGVSDNPRRKVGMKKRFMEIDDSQISQVINQHLSPSPFFEREEYIFDKKRYGIIYVYPADTKPIICIRDFDKILSESSIYFRYSAQSSIIKSGDLFSLLEEERKKENAKWMRLFSSAATIGVNNIGFFDASSGKISTQKGNSFLLDDKILSRLKVLDRYSIHEDGAEAVKIVAEINQTGTLIDRPFAINEDEIINGFLLNQEILSPREYLEAMCYQTSAYLPMYFYIKRLNLNKKEVIQIFSDIKTRIRTKGKLIQRLNSDSKIRSLNTAFPIDDSTSVRSRRKKYFEKLKQSKTVEFKTGGEIKRLLEAICNLDVDSYNPEYVKKIIFDIWNNHYAVSYSTLIRQTICYLDLIENE